MEEYLADKQDMAPLIIVNSFGNYDHQVSRILFDTDEAAKGLVQEILKQESGLQSVTCLTGESQISAEVYKSLKKALAAEGIETESMTMNHGAEEAQGVLIGCGPQELRQYWAQQGYASDERSKLETLLEEGFTDAFRHLYPDRAGAYTWWSNRLNKRDENRGWRLDYFFLSDDMVDTLKDVRHLVDVTGSDHCPIVLELAL